MKRLIMLGLLATAPAMAQTPETISRLEAAQASNAIAEIGQYQCPNSGPGAQPVVTCFLKVPVPMRSVLAHDMRILLEITKENQAALPPNASVNDQAKLGEQKVPVPDLQKFTEDDLHLADNPQITPVIEAMLAPLMKSPEPSK
jgi:hypothetical protein